MSNRYGRMVALFFCYFFVMTLSKGAAHSGHMMLDDAVKRRRR